MTVTLEEKKGFSIDDAKHLWPEFLVALKRKAKSIFLFHFLFLGIGCAELFLFTSSLLFLGQKSLSAFILALFFLTLFSYFVLRLYFQTKKREEILFLCTSYLDECKKSFHYQEGIIEHHLALAASSKRMATLLNEKEYSCITIPLFLQPIHRSFEKLSALCHWKDFFYAKELLLKRAIEEHIKVVTLVPTSIRAHAELASSYVMLSRLYIDPRKYEGIDEERWIPKERLSEKMQQISREIAELAIEEFQILNDYAPTDPWVHNQLALSFRDLQMPDEEIREYEILLGLSPHDIDILSKLGTLYFQRGKNAKALHIFEQLKELNAEKADKLIKLYGTSDRFHRWE